MFGRKPASVRTLGLIAFASAVVFAGGVAWITSLPDTEDRLSLWLALPTVLAAMALLYSSIVFTLAYWRHLDEAAREAHKWAWYWGGSLGIIPGFFIATWGDSVARAGGLGFTEPGELIEFGVVTILLSMLVGYLLAWGVWWSRKR